MGQMFMTIFKNNIKTEEIKIIKCDMLKYFEEKELKVIITCEYREEIKEDVENNINADFEDAR